MASSEGEEEVHKEYLLASLRGASLRAKIADADITTIGIALSKGLINSETAVAWIRDSGLMMFIGVIPESVGRIAKANPPITDQTGDESCDR